MKRIHIEFDCILTNKDAQELLSASEVCLQDNIMDALDINDECNDIRNFSIKLVKDEDYDTGTI